MTRDQVLAGIKALGIEFDKDARVTNRPVFVRIQEAYYDGFLHLDGHESLDMAYVTDEINSEVNSAFPITAICALERSETE